MELIRYWRIVRRWAWLIILCPLVAALAAGLISLQLPKIYEANVLLYVRTAQLIPQTPGVAPFSSPVVSGAVPAPPTTADPGSTTAEVMRGTLKLQSSLALHYYLEELHLLGGELSIAAHLADVSEELRALAERSPDTSPHRSGEPYRLAVSGIYARLAATAKKLGIQISRVPVGAVAAYESVEEFHDDLDGRLWARARRL